MNKLTLNNIARVLVGENGMGQKAATEFATAMFDLIQEQINAEGLVKVKGLGTFKKIQVEPRESINVRTGERVLIDSHDKITFTPDSVMKELVNRPFSQFETVALNEDVQFADIKSEETAEENSPAEQQKPVAEEPSEPVEESVSEYDDTDEETETHRLRHAGLLLLVAVLMAASAVGGYLYGIRQHTSRHMPQETNRAEHPVPVKTDTLARDTLARDTVKVETPAVKKDTASTDTLEKYNAMDVRVRLGAYKIVGTQREVKAQAGDNLKRIAKREFGSEEMVCYLEVYNGLGADQKLEKGQTVRIPALKWKKKKRQNP